MKDGLSIMNNELTQLANSISIILELKTKASIMV